MGIDWFAVVVLGIAWAISNVRTIPLAVRHWIFAVGCFVVAGNRLLHGAQGINLVFVLIAGGIGVQYVMRALKTPRS